MKLSKIIPIGGNNKKRKNASSLVRGAFQPDWYADRYPEILESGLEPFEHYLRYGDAEGYWPNPYFDPKYYRSIAPGARKSSGPALEHYVTKGWQRGRNPSRNFSLALYIREYPEAASSGMDPVQYHLQVGRFKGGISFPLSLEHPNEAHLSKVMRTIHASRLFDINWYRAHYSDLWYTDMDLLYHYAKFGWTEERKPNLFFDPVWYSQTYLADEIKQNPLLFYIEKGFALGHNPSAHFCAKTYIRENSALLAKGAEPLAHYLSIGLRKGLEKPIPVSRKPKTAVSTVTEIPLPLALRSTIEFTPTELQPPVKSFDPNHLVLHWIIPAFAPGGGGHMTIFRMVHFLELAGHKQTIWIHNPNPGETPEAAYQVIENHFQHFTGDVKFVDETLMDAEGDAVIATDCWTVFPALACRKFHRRFYFVQDFEPSFHPMGANYLLADQTYREDLDCLCASPWLSDMMTETYGRWARHFWLAADTRLYFPLADRTKNSKLRIAVYARHFTARRAVELVFLALEELATANNDFIVDFFGAPLDFNHARFEFVDHGVASQENLARIFQNADLGVVFSATNYSLVPQEMMACGLPIIELDGASTRAIFPNDVVTLAKPHPRAIADTIASLLADETRRAKQADAALQWVRQFSWSGSASLVENAIIERLGEFAQPEPSPRTTANAAPKASIVIPTLNAGPVLAKVLEATVNQRAPWPFEILVIDSGSTDETLDIIAKYPDVRLHQIDKSEFNHGATRNLGAALTSGEFIAFLTHDAMPYNDRWLYNLVTSVERFPDAAGAFGKHLAWPEASDFTKRDLRRHFELFSNLPLSVGRDTNKKRWRDKDQQWQQQLHFYSDNNSCMRRKVWEKIPYRAVAFGEDQLWAWDIVNAGYEKVYAPQACVYHSHDYNEQETFERCEIESAFFKHFFGYELMKDEKTMEKTTEILNLSDIDWGRKHGVDEQSIRLRQQLNAARLKGYLSGFQADTTKLFGQAPTTPEAGS